MRVPFGKGHFLHWSPTNHKVWFFSACQLHSGQFSNRRIGTENNQKVVIAGPNLRTSSCLLMALVNIFIVVQRRANKNGSSFLLMHCPALQTIGDCVCLFEYLLISLNPNWGGRWTSGQKELVHKIQWKPFRCAFRWKSILAILLFVILLSFPTTPLAPPHADHHLVERSTTLFAE